MIRRFWLRFGIFALGASACLAQDPSPKWEELTSADFIQAINKASGVCLLPLGSIDPSGPTQPLGTANYVARTVTQEAVKQEYAVVFPDYFVSRINSSSSLPGAIAYSEHLQVEFLLETVREMARNGCKKILLVNTHSPNAGLITSLMTADMGKPHDYVLYTVFGGPPRMTPLTAETAKLPIAMRASKPDADGHGGEDRTSVMMAYYPSLAHPERTIDPPGRHTSTNLPAGVTAEFSAMPTGYAGDPSGATAERGRALVAYSAEVVAKAIRAIKADDLRPKLLKEFFNKVQNPLP